MSVGGRVVEVVPVTPGKVWVNTDDNPHRTYGSLPNLCAIYVDPDGHQIRVGDSLWWQSGVAYWTPKTGENFGASDIPLRKIGYSGVARPPLGREGEVEP